MSSAVLVVAIFVLIAIPVVVAAARARCLAVSIGLDRGMRRDLAEFDFEDWEGECR